MNITKVLTLGLLCLITSTNCFAQNYFYSSIKIPLIEYITYALSDQVEDSDYGKTEGALFDLGYGIQIKEYFIIEAGAEAYIINPLTKGYSRGSISDQLDVSNRAFAAQIRPVLRLELEESFFLRFSTALSYRQLYSSGRFYSDLEAATINNFHNISYSSSRSRFNLNLQPSIGLEQKLNDNWLLVLDLTYVQVNWNKSLDNLRFNVQPQLVIPKHKTATMFFTGRIMFR